MRRIRRWRLLLVVVAGVGLQACTPATPYLDAKKKGKGGLSLVESVTRNDLQKVVSATISPDGKFLYASMWNPGSLIVFARDQKTGKLDHAQTLDDRNRLAGATSISLSRDGRLAIAAAFRSKALVLYRREAGTGRLTLSDSPVLKGPGMAFPVMAAFSPDAKYVCVADDDGSRDLDRAALWTFRINDDKIEYVATDQGRSNCYYGSRGLAFHPDGKTVFVACCRPGSLVVADRDPETGKTSPRQILWANAIGSTDYSKPEVGDVPGILGVMSVATSPDGKFVYTCSGRFGGESAVAAFQFGDDGRLAFLQKYSNGSNGELVGFEGGNQLAISPDGLNLYAAATVSGVVACFRRDPKTGNLTHLETLPDGGQAGGGFLRVSNTLGAAGFGISPDGQYVYVATEDKNTLSVFKREPPR
jgi:6-phosphogluconolactonase